MPSREREREQKRRERAEFGKKKRKILLLIHTRSFPNNNTKRHLHITSSILMQWKALLNTHTLGTRHTYKTKRIVSD